MDEKRISKLKDVDDFSLYTSSEKYQLYSLFFCLGIFNHLGIILVLTGCRLLAKELDMSDWVTLYTSMSTIFSMIIRLINSKLCIQISYKKRIILNCIMMIIGFSSMFLVLTLHDNILNSNSILCFILSFIPCFFLGASFAFGESAIVSYLRMFPKNLIAAWSSGTGLSSIVSASLNFSTQLIKGLSLKYLYLFLTPVGPLYLLFFLLTFKILKKDDTCIENKVNKIEMDNNDNNNNENPERENLVENNENNEENLTNKENDDKKIMDEMNKQNQPMSCHNFLQVMKMDGRLNINLGFIYLIEFLCHNCVTIQVCAKMDIPFLPKETDTEGNLSRKGKYEFVTLFFQLGMFLSKTFVKFVRKIRPIEVFTIGVSTVTVLYFVEYYTGIFPWWCFPIFTLVLGCFAGGTYAVGFYIILHSDQVLLDYKELAVNIATLFNDGGTFLSGLVGLMFIKYIISSVEPFPNQTPV